MRCSSRCSSKRGMRTNFLKVDSLMCMACANLIWFLTRASICSVSWLENRKRRQISSAILTPTSTWPSKRMRSGATRNVGGLPTSCRSAPHARVGGHEWRRESHRAQHAQFIFSKTQLWLADRADDSSVQILSPTNKIEHFVLEGVQQQAVDGEIAALNVLAGILAEPYLIGMAAVGIADIRTEGCDLDGF